MAVAAETSMDTVPPTVTRVKRQAVFREQQGGSAHSAAKLLTKDESQRIAITRVRFDHTLWQLPAHPAENARHILDRELYRWLHQSGPRHDSSMSALCH
jgi:hypothetical protein